MGMMTNTLGFSSSFPLESHHFASFNSKQIKCLNHNSNESNINLPYFECYTLSMFGSLNKRLMYSSFKYNTVDITQCVIPQFRPLHFALTKQNKQVLLYYARTILGVWIAVGDFVNISVNVQYMLNLVPFYCVYIWLSNPKSSNILLSTLFTDA